MFQIVESEALADYELFAIIYLASSDPYDFYAGISASVVTTAEFQEIVIRFMNIHREKGGGKDTPVKIVPNFQAGSVFLDFLDTLFPDDVDSE